ncbi:putative B6 ABC transporter ATP-binding protein [Celeribacter litoreus]|uniref:putative B6 ABC transporter ATP-binding protein n=1 Tax=Celeribacter litoreus TaxID=2876714 RepID=UPI001CCA1590|nr:ABC transporter ATP-binding protein [Celeribacter litoreus]MCA0042476.1 ABC transporter ATP-binding protein [Celeribacter litoreus]
MLDASTPEHSAQPSTEAPPIVTFEGVTKRYPGIIANDSIDMEFRAGEVHVLLGENGAGKSTLVSMLSGLQQPDDGRILIDGVEKPISSPADALDIGISTVFQHSMLVPSLTLVENATLGRKWWQAPDRAGTAGAMKTAAERIGVTLDPMALTGDLSLGERQQAEITRALMRGARFLILDEATAMLTPNDAARLGELMQRLAAEGMAVVFITHKLNEAVAYGDRISVLRLGKKVGGLTPEELKSLDAQEATNQVVRLMFGTQGAQSGDAERPDMSTVDRDAKPTLELLALYADSGRVPLSNIEFKVWPGEILGIAGIDGNGQKQLAAALAGQAPISDGRVVLDGDYIDRMSIGQRRAKGMRYVTDDRLGEGTVGTFPMSINLLLKEIGEAPFWRSGLEQPEAIRENARRQVRDYDIRTPSIETPIGKLSGGNIQKVLLARELSGSARVVIFEKPTYGLDLANIAATQTRIRETAQSGAAVILISTELDEILALSHRIAVMDQGEIKGIVENTDGARHKIGELMSGVKK